MDSDANDALFDEVEELSGVRVKFLLRSHVVVEGRTADWKAYREEKGKQKE